MCGLRFLPSAQERYDEHLDWHFRQNANRDRQLRANNRNSYIDLTVSHIILTVIIESCPLLSHCIPRYSQDWISYEEYTDITESNIFLANQESGQTAPQSALSMHPDAVHCPIASSDKDDVSIL